MKRFFIVFVIICLMFSTGCSANGSLFSNYRPIEQLKLVHTIGFDIHDEGLLLSVCGGEQDGQGIMRLYASGKNISDCLSGLQNFSGKEELYYAHTRYVLVGEEYAKQGLGDVMQYLESSNQLRSDLPLFVVKGGTAKDLLLKAGGEDAGIHEVLEAVMRDCTTQGIAFPFSCGDLGSFSAEYGSAIACALEQKPTNAIDPDADEEEVTPVAVGYGILKNGKLAGFLSENASRAVNFLIDETGTEPFTVTLSGQPVSLQIKKVKTTLLPAFHENGSIKQFTAALSMECVLEESEQSVSPDLDALGAALESSVQQWLEELLMAMRSTECDFLGFGPRIAIEYPRTVFNTSVKWTEQLRTLPMYAQVHCTINLGENEPRR